MMKPNSLAIIALIIQLMYCRAVRSGVPDTNGIISTNLKAWNIRNTDPELSKKWAESAIKAAASINYQRGISNSLNIIGHYYEIKGHYNLAESFYRKSLAIRQKQKDSLKMAISLRNIVLIEKQRGKYTNAIETGLSAIRLLKSKITPDADRERAWLMTIIAPIYNKTGEFEKAVSFAVNAKSTFRRLNNEEGLYAATLNLGNIYDTQKQYRKALAEYRLCLDYYSETENLRELAKTHNNIANVYEALKKDSLALLEYKKGLAIQVKNGFTDDIKFSINNIGLIYEAFGKNDSAALYYNQALKMSRLAGDVEVESEAHRALGELLKKQKDYQQALSHLLRSLRLSTVSSRTPERIPLLKEISETYRAIGKADSAFIYGNDYSQLNDSISLKLTNSIIVESNLKAKEYELALSEQKNKSQWIIIIGISIAFVLVLIIFLMYHVSAQAKKRELQLKQVIKEKELEALDAMLEGQEQERKRLAAELHDTIGSILSATKYTFKAMENSIEKIISENKTQYLKIDSMLDEAMDSVRRISHNISEGILTEKGLEGVLTDLCHTLGEPGKIKFRLDMHGFDRRIDYAIESNLYRIIQELITNVIKHAHAQQVNVQLLKSKGNINLIVEDNGKGFDPKELNLKKGIGLSNIDDRVKKLSGTWNIDSGKGRGTTVVIDVPVNETEI